MKSHLYWAGLALCLTVGNAGPYTLAEEPAAASVTLSATEFNAKTTGFPEGKAWNLCQNGQLDCVLNFQASNTFTFILIARGESAADVWPKMRVTLDGQTIFQGSVDSAQWIPYTFNASVEKGLHEVSVAFINDFYQAPQDRNLHLSDLTITVPEQAQVPVQLTAAEFERFQNARLRQWTQQAEKDIARHRKGKLVVWVTDEKDNPLTNVLVQVRQTRHEFPFGTALANLFFEESTSTGDVERGLAEAKRLFNSAVTENAMKWDHMAPESTQTTYAVLDRMLAWCASNRIPLRGHCLFWGCHYPQWAGALSDEELRQALEARATKVVARYAASIPELDVINEPMHCPYFSDRLGAGIVKSMFEWTREANPVSVRYLNDYNILTEGETDAYVEYIRRQLDAGAGISGIGVQAHFNGEADPFRITRALNALAPFQLPIKITEFDCDSTNEAVRLQCLETLYRAAFAHPAVKGILMWGFWEKAHWLPHSALLREDFSRTAMADRYERLVFHDWWTRDEGRTDVVGRHESSAFFGEYEVEVRHPGRAPFHTNLVLRADLGAEEVAARLVPGEDEEAALQETAEPSDDYDAPVGR